MSKHDEPRAPEIIERFAKELVITAKAVVLYPQGSNIPLDAARKAAAVLREVLEQRPEITIGVAKQGINFQGLPIHPDQIAYTNFAVELYNRMIAGVRFHSGTEAHDIVAFLTLLKATPMEIESAGGAESMLWELGCGTVTLQMAHVSLVDDARRDPAAESVKALSREEIDEMLNSAYSGRAREQKMITRFIGQPHQVRQYLIESSAGEGTSVLDLVKMGERFAEMAEVAFGAGGDTEKYELLRNLSEALKDLEPSIRRALLVDEVLPEARTNEALASVVRQMDVDDLCRMLAEEFEPDEASREGLARAIRNLALMSMAERDEVISAAGAAMRGAGFSEEQVTDVLERTSPSRLQVREQASAAASERPADAIFKLMDLAPNATRALAFDDDPGVAALREEAHFGITDSDVLMSLVTLATLDHRETQFASTMAMIEDALDIVVERGDLVIAADAADALLLTAKAKDLTVAQCNRVHKAISRLTKPSDIRSMAQVLRIHEAGSSEAEAARRLFDALGPLTIGPLVEHVAEEQDMATRKLLIDMLTDLAPEHVEDLGRYVTDQRWFVVRNVVGILGSTRSSAVLPYIERTVRHHDTRVRREAIRALANIQDRLAHQMLVSSLTDEDAQNVQLAARYLGAAGVELAVPALIAVAQGEGAGNRDTGPRVEAIEALGKLGSADALPALEAIAGRRSIIGAARIRELKAAAESAIARLKAGKGGVG